MKPNATVLRSPLGVADCQFMPLSGTQRVIICCAVAGYTVSVVAAGIVVRDASWPSMLFAGTLCLMYTIAALPMFAFGGRLSLIHPLFFGSLLFFVSSASRSAVSEIIGVRGHAGLMNYDEHSLLKLSSFKNVCTALSLLSTYVGFLWIPIPLLLLRRKTMPLRLNVLWILLTSFSVSVVGLLMLSDISGGIYGHMLNLFRGLTAQQYVKEVKGVGQYVILAKFACVGMLIWIAAEARVHRKPIFWLCAMAALFLAFASSGRRSALVFPALLFILVWIVRHRRIPYVALGVTAVLLVMFMSYVQAVREAVWSTDESSLRIVSAAREGRISSFIEEINSRAGEYSSAHAVYATVPEFQPLLLGRSYFNALLLFIPRSLWEAKPEGIELTAGRVFFGVDWSIPPGAVAEAYWNFHLAGVIGVFLVYGALMRWIWASLIADPNNPIKCVFYVASLVVLKPSQTAITEWLLLVTPLVVLVLVGRRSTAIYSA